MEKITCECGSVINKNREASHCLSKKHHNWVNRLLFMKPIKPKYNKKDKMTCECGSIFQKKNKSLHEKTCKCVIWYNL